MKAIRISNKIKNKNKQNWVQRREIGDIVRRDLPNSFYESENVAGGYAGRTDLHDADGWREFKNLIDGVDYDSTTQKLNTNLIVGYPIGEPLANRTHYAFKIVDLTPEQIAQNSEDSDQNQAREKINSYKEDGNNLIERTRTKMWRRVHLFPDGNNGLTKPQVAKLERWFEDTYLALLVGNYRQARNYINNLIEQRDNITGDSSLLETEGMLDTALWLQSKIENYFSNQYDM